MAYGPNDHHDHCSENNDDSDLNDSGTFTFVSATTGKFLYGES